MKLFSFFLSLVMLVTVPARAAIILETYEFDTNPALSPIPTLQGSFAFSYDDSVAFNPVLESIDFTIGGFDFTTSNTGIVPITNGYALGGTLNGVNTLNRNNMPDPYDFWLRVFSDSLGNNYVFFNYLQRGQLSAWFDGSANLSLLSSEVVTTPPPGNGITPPVTPPGGAVVPEPATWALLVLGFGLVGQALRATRRQGLRPA